MKPLTIMNDAELGRHVERLRRDVNDFCGRAAQVAREGDEATRYNYAVRQR